MLTFRTFLSVYPWDLLEEDLNAVLDLLHGEIGLTGLSVWVASPPVMELRVRDVQPRVFHTRGGLLFAPDEKHYADSRCKPIVSTWAKGRNPAARIAEACAKRGLDLRLMVSASRTGRLAERHPEMASKNAFGDQSQLGLCLSNPDVQTYLCGLVSDLSSNYAVSGLTIADFVLGWPEAFAAELHAPSFLDRRLLPLLAMCFCESCRQQAAHAALDPAATQRSVRTILQTRLDGGRVDQPWDAVLAENGPLTDYCRWRAKELSGLWQQMTKACRCDLLLDRPPDTAISAHVPTFDLNLPAVVITRLDDPEGLTRARCAVARRNELRLPEPFVSGPHAAQLVRTVSQAAELGFGGVEIDTLGLLPDSAFTPIRQAVRFARRSTAEDS